MGAKNFKLQSGAVGNRKLVIDFFLRLAVLLTVWLVLYNRLIYPAGTIDTPLTKILSASVVKTVNVLESNSIPLTYNQFPEKHFAQLVRDNKRVLTIADNCNGVDLVVIYLSIIILLPYPAKRKIIFGLAGIAAIIIANIIRITALYFIFLHRPESFSFNHHYLFTILMYALIFYGWMLFIKKKVPQ